MPMGNIWVQISTIYLAGITGIYKGIPVGFALHAHPVLTAAFTALGSITIVLVILLSGQPLKKWVVRQYGHHRLEKKKGKFIRMMDRYGVAGLGLVASGLIGPILSTILGITLIQKTRRLMIFLIAGIVLWSSLLTALASLGLTALLRVMG
mgnify:CR=1 FL=1